MNDFFYQLGKTAGEKTRKAKWFWDSVTGSKADGIRAEREVGVNLAAEVKATWSGQAPPELTALLGDIGERLKGCVAEKLHRFNFESSPPSAPNAFALPGGYIFVDASLIHLCEGDRDELAFVLGHEMGHVILGHAMERVATGAAIQTATRATPLRGVLAGWLQNVGTKFLQSAHAQKQEFAADAMGQALMHAAKFDRTAADRLLQRLDAIAPTLDPISEYLSTHPPTAKRLENLRKRRR